MGMQGDFFQLLKAQGYQFGASVGPGSDQPFTTATTILALLPVLTSTGRGADLMIPMALPSFGGMTIELVTLFVVPVLYSLWKELGVRFATASRG